MTISFDLPVGIEKQLRQELADLDQVAKEAALVELYRHGQLSHGKLAECLGISRYESDAVLKRHNVTEDLLTVEEFTEQAAALRRRLGGMIVVSDTSPLNYLVLIGQVEILPDLFDRVVAPPAVMAELSQSGTPTVVATWAASAPKWLEVITPSAVDLSLPLGLGEAEAIALAQELRADGILIDERKGSAVARRLGLVATGTLNVLDLAAERGLIALPDAIAGLRRTNFRAPEKLISELLQRDQLRQSRGGPQKRGLA